MKFKHRNPTGTVHGVEYQDPGLLEPWKFDHTLKDLNNIVKKNIFSEDQVKRIYSAIQSAEKKNYFNTKPRGQAYTVGWDLPEDVRKTVQDIAKEETGEDWLVADFALCTYTTQVGIPELKMHRDENFATQRVCFDYQLESNTSWDIIVGRERYEMEDNSGILFSSTDQYHGRPVKEFTDTDYMKLIFFHMSKDGKHDSKEENENNILVN
jgi:hypothetical protein